MTYTDFTALHAKHGSLHTLSDQECWGLLSSTTVGRVAFVSASGIQLLPVNFQFLGGIIYFQTSPDSILAETGSGLDVAFCVGSHDELLQTGWSVVISGTSSIVEDPLELADVRASDRLRPWAPGARSLVIAITPRITSGRKVSRY